MDKKAAWVNWNVTGLIPLWLVYLIFYRFMKVRRVLCGKNEGVKPLRKRTQKRDKENEWWGYQIRSFDRKCLDALVK